MVGPAATGTCSNHVDQGTCAAMSGAWCPSGGCATCTTCLVPGDQQMQNRGTAYTCWNYDPTDPSKSSASDCTSTGGTWCGGGGGGGNTGGAGTTSNGDR